MRNFLKPDFEKSQLGEYDVVIGIDEVGRGAWAGPVAVGFFVFSSLSESVAGVNDSKIVSKKKRDELSKILSSEMHKIFFEEVHNIDRVGIGKSIENLISKGIAEFSSKFINPLFILDGQFSKKFNENVIVKTKADSTFYSVAAASILAKVARDLRMVKESETYLGFEFEKNVGYPSHFHIKVLRELGPTKIHRRSYKPIKLLLDSNLL